MSHIKTSHGFTLIELLIVVLIIGILAAIAIPVFNGQRVKAKNTVAKSSVRNAYSAASVVKTVTEDRFDMISGQNISEEEKTLKFVNQPPELPGSEADPYAVSVYFFDSDIGKWVQGDDGADILTNPEDWTPPTDVTNSVGLCSASKGNTVYCVAQKSGPSGDFEKVVMGSEELTPSTPSETTGDDLAVEALEKTSNNW